MQQIDGQGPGGQRSTGRDAVVFRPVEACVDYRAYVVSLPKGTTPDIYAQWVSRLCGLGRVVEERLGVRYVKGPWGFLVVPPLGFPELKITFYHPTAQVDEAEVLAKVEAILAQA